MPPTLPRFSPRFGLTSSVSGLLWAGFFPGIGACTGGFPLRLGLLLLDIHAHPILLPA